MIHFRSKSIKKTLTAMSMLASSSALLLACSGFVLYDLTTLRKVMVRGLTTQAQIVGSNSVSSLVFADPRSAEATLAALRAEPSIVSAGLYGRDGKLFASYQRDGGGQNPPRPGLPATPNTSYRFESRRLVLIHPIVFEGERVGTVLIESDLREMYSRLAQYALIVSIVLAASTLLAFLISGKLQRPISQAVLHLAETARMVSRKKDYSVRAAPSGTRDELALLTDTFNEMLSEIQRRDEALERAHREVELRVQARTAELQTLNAELESFTYSVSHDLRAPLRHMDGFSKLLLEEYSPQLPEEAREYLSLIRDGARDMSQLVDDLLNLARVGRKELALQITGLSPLVEEVVSTLKAESAGRAIEWKVQPLPFAECDPSLMKQVFTNLLSNAVKFTRPRKVAVIEVGATAQDSQSVIFVRDNGVGFHRKHVDKLFRVFQRLHRQEDFEGTGVGLAIIQRIIHKHGGRVWADAELDHGAVFYFTLGIPKESGLEIDSAGR